MEHNSASSKQKSPWPAVCDLIGGWGCHVTLLSTFLFLLPHACSPHCQGRDGSLMAEVEHADCEVQTRGEGAL